MSSSQIVILTLIVMTTALLLLSTRRRVAKSRRNADVPFTKRYSQLQDQRAATRDVSAIMIELDHLARQIHGQIDTRFAKLEAVIRDADKRIATLSQLAQNAQSPPALDVTLDSESPQLTATTSDQEAVDKHGAIYRLADSGRSAMEIANEIESTPGEIELILALRKTRQMHRTNENSAEVESAIAPA